MKRYNWKKILTNTAWCMVGAGTIVLLCAAMQQKARKRCSDIRIEITGAEKHMFIDEKDVMDMLQAGGTAKGIPLHAIDLRALESLLEKNPWVQNAEMYLDNNQVLEIRITERQPIARLFTRDGYSFYLDSAGLRLPLSDKLSARVPVFTGFPTGRPVLSKPDSLLLNDVVNIGQRILADSFWMAQAGQIDITGEAKFEIVPVIGDHIIHLGSAEEIDAKLKRLYTFYKKAWLQNGINTYEKLDAQYAGQVVAVKTGTARTQVDSARARQIMDALVRNPIIVPDSNNKATVSLKLPVRAKDSVKTTAKPAPVVRSQSALPAGTKTVTTPNNKTNKNTLSVKAKSGTTARPVKTPEKRQPKAVLKKAGR